MGFMQPAGNERWLRSLLGLAIVGCAGLAAWTGGCGRALWWAAAPWVALGVGCAACLSVSVVDVAVWPSAGLARTNTPAESSHADLRIISLSPSGTQARSKETLIPKRP